MSKDSLMNRIPAVLIPVMTTLLGFAIAVALVFVITFFERRGSWKRLDSPPGEAVRLVAAGAVAGIFLLLDRR